ncbi:MAG: decaprenyl-phosphate phosphoribosyltransferase [Bacteroidota bacterium]|nr:decaprenyl-phosphate phosphoribosyltransferase [Bacteroidota bacterium]
MGIPLTYILQSARLHQWVKNFFIFAALIFSGHLFILNDLLLTAAGFFIFSLATSAIYIFNDVADIEKDKLHPEKSKRPLPSGNLKISTALIASAILALSALLLSFSLNFNFAFVLIGYIIINIFYSLYIKSLVILDVMTIAAGFVLRIYAGALLISVPVSEWLIICTILLALFLGFSKRRSELVLLENSANTHRSVLGHYSPQFLDQMIGIVTASTVMSYALYTISEETVLKLGTNNLIYTVPFVLYGIFRYLYLVHKKEVGGNPTLAILKDIPLLINLILWIISAGIIIYWR